MSKSRLVLFDGHAIVYRAYHAFQVAKGPTVLTVPKTGEIITAVFGFAQMLLKAINELQPTHYAIAFDTKAPTFRHQLFDQYKAHRPPTPDELVNQLGRVRQLVETFHMPIFEVDGYEADDVLGTLSHQASEHDVETVIVTGDADAMQLISPVVKVLYPKPRKSFSDTMLYDEEAVNQKYGVMPEYIADLKALIGDPSDNIPGVSGIGGKTAAKLIQQFSGIEQIYEHIDEVTPPKLQILLRENEAVARRSKELATITIKAPVTLDMSACIISHFDRNEVADLFRKLGFFSLLSKLPEEKQITPEGNLQTETITPLKQDYHIVNTASELNNLLNRLSSAKSFTFDVETTELNPATAQLVGLSCSPARGEAYYIPMGHISLENIQQLPMEHVIERIKPIMEDSTLAKVAHNGKYDMTVLANCGISVSNLSFDTMVAAHLLNEKTLSLKAIAFNKLGIEMKPIIELIGSGSKQIPMSQVPIEQAADYACADADMIFILAESLRQELHQQGLWELFSKVEMPLVPVLFRMERNGIILDREPLRQMSHRIGKQLLRIEAEIYNHVGHQFNINSPKQLSCVLFDELRLSSGKGRGKSTALPFLEELRHTHPIIELVISYRQLAKLKSTYIDALPGLIDPRTQRVHTSFNQTRTTTGRLSSSEPNLQNIPIRDEPAKQIRLAFIAPPRSYLLAGDYSQIDLRALAHLSRDIGLINAFQQDEDIHTATAARFFDVTDSQVSLDMRRLAKTINFGVIYGMSDYGLEQATELSREEAAKFITAYFEKYPGVREYLASTKKQAREKGYVQTLLGRKRYTPEVNSPNRQIREAAERMAINMPVQGTSADIIKVAMLNLDREMKNKNMESRMLLQVHDELIFEVPEEEMESMCQLVPEIMSSAVRLNVPIKVDIKTGKNWGEMK
jgi:DNA polymerase-1